MASGSRLEPGLGGIGTLTFTADRILSQALSLQSGSLLEFSSSGPPSFTEAILADYNYLGNNQVALVRGAAVPAPLPVLGMAGALRWSRRLRRRLRGSR